MNVIEKWVIVMKVLKFSAVWCGSCLVMKPIWKEVINEIPNAEFIEYDYDLDEDEVLRYNVGDKLPVFILLNEDGKEIKRLIGEKKKEDIISFIKE